MSAQPDPMHEPSRGPVCEKCSEVHERNGIATCKAHRRDGKPCLNAPLTGQATCRMHGGATKAAKAAGKRRAALSFTEGKIAQLLKEVDMPAQHPLDGLLEVVRHSGAMMRMLAGLVGELAVHPTESDEQWSMDEEGNLSIRKQGALYGALHTGDAAPSVLVQLYGVWSDRYARACKLALDANIDERLVRNAETTSEVMFTALTRALDEAELDAVQMGKIRGALANELRRMTGVAELEG